MDQSSERTVRLRALLCLAVLSGGLTAAGWSDWLEGRLGLSAPYLLRGATAPPPAAAIIGLDDAAREALALDAHRLPAAIPRLADCLPASSVEPLAQARSIEDLPRPVVACLLRALAADGADAIVVDIHFSAPGSPEGDAILAAAIGSVGRVYLLEEIRFDAATGATIRQTPLRAFAEASAGHGYFLVDDGGDRTGRYVAGLEHFPDAAPLHRRALGRSATPVPIGEGVALARLALYGPAGTTPIQRVTDYLGRRPDPSRFAGRVVFVGAASVDSLSERDSFAWAWKGLGPGLVSGVELLATAFPNELEGSALQRAPRPVEAAIVFALVAAQAWAVSSLGAVTGGAAALAIAAAHLPAAVWGFGAFAVWLPVALPAFLAPPATLLLHVFLRYRSALLWRWRARLGK